MFCALLAPLLASSLFAWSVRAVDLTVGTSAGNSTSPLMYGTLYEDIYHSGDGGLYAELIQNRAFQGTAVHVSNNRIVGPFQNLDYWHAIGSNISLDTSSPTVSSGLPYQMRVDFPSGSTGAVGVYNDGFGGFNITTKTRYSASFYLRGDYSGQVLAAYQSISGGSTLGSTSFSINQKASDGWKKYTQIFTPTASQSDGQATFRLTFDGATVAGKSLYLQVVSSFQQTYFDRANGVRMDLARAVADMTPKFVRLPGGNNLEGLSSPYRLKWNETIGDISTRPMFPGTWGYINTQGFGLLEQIQWALDTGMTPILGLWAGLYLDGEVIASGDLQPYVTDVMNELEFFLGSSSTTYGALRASLGYQNPINISYVEIGNEDYLNGGANSYTSYRFSTFYNAIKNKYPNLRVITSIVVNSYPTNNRPAVGTIQDLHEYTSADAFASKFNVYDQTDRRYPVFIGEYAAISDPSSGGNQLNDPTLQSATSEAVYFCGLERNADAIFGVAHGAMIKSLRENPDNVALMKHDATSIVFSYSYYVFKLFSNYFGTATVPITGSSAYGPVYWSGTKTGSSYYIKMAIYGGSSSTPMSVTIPGKTSAATLYTLTGPSASSTNTKGSITSVVSSTSVSPTNGKYSFTLSGAYTVAVLVAN